jgi:effector-binding domain-containing protein
MREMEMPLGDIRRVLAAEQDEAEALVLAYEQDFAARLVAVRDGRRRLIETFRQEEHPMSLPVEVRELEKQQIVSIQGHVLVSDLDAFIDRSLQRLMAFVEAQGGRASGPPLGLYHGQVNQQDDGPIEVCLPAQDAFKAEGDIGIRELPGGRAAVVVAEGDYSSFPKILEAYDAGYDWLQSNGHQPLESPREVWVGSPQSEGPFEIMWRFA